MTIDMSSVVNLREPGLGQEWIGKERYVIRAGAVIAVPMMTGDELQIIDPEGRQSAMVFAFDSSGETATAKLGIAPNSNGETLARLLHSKSPVATKIRSKLDAFAIELAKADSAKILTGDTVAGSSITLVSESELICLVGTTCEAMAVDEQTPPTDLVAFITRANPGAVIANELPDPLADEQQSIRIDAGTAVSYEINAGDYIQIIDIDGRQCSDFQCFDLRQLEKGKLRYLDATSTRTLMGSAYPGPGLYSKFYDVDFDPVVEVIQDTCGRHDSFGLACASKYYEEAGYPGHPNCSDNINKALVDYAVESRKGWTAMNLFFNTFFDDAYTFMFDNPWSRPGDYVLMRALKDMVCVTTSCTCDIDAANAWNLTDIQVRTYSKENLFKRAIAFRKTTDAEPEMTKETGFHNRTSKLTRNFSEYNGYWLANQFNNYGATAEYWACREGVVVTDLSPLRKYEVTGPDAEVLMQTCVTRDIRKMANGHVVYTAMCYESGGMIDDGTVFKLGKDNFRWIGGNDASGLWLRQQAQERKMRAWVKDSTSQLNNLQVQGPKSLDVVRKIIWTRPDQPTADELGWFRFSIARIGDDKGIPVILSRTGYTGEQGYEIFCHPRDAESVWDAVWEAGQEFKIAPLGLEALDMLRIEAGLIFAGAEFCDQTDPFEAGIGFTVPLKSKTDDFIGRAELVKRKAHPQEKLTGLEVAGEEPGGNGEGVFIGREQVGTITSGTISPILRKNIALCKMKVIHAEPGTEVEIGKLDGHQKRIPAKVVAYPHFDPTKERVKGNYS
jgi:aminomethyltransferase